MNVPVATSASVSSVHSSSEPVHQWMLVGLGQLGDLVDEGEDARVRGRSISMTLVAVMGPSRAFSTTTPSAAERIGDVSRCEDRRAIAGIRSGSKVPVPHATSYWIDQRALGPADFADVVPRANILGPHHAPVAQRIEHLTTDQKVWGSNPYRRASRAQRRRPRDAFPRGLRSRPAPSLVPWRRRTGSWPPRSVASSVTTSRSSANCMSGGRPCSR